jgi:hypothetical protein
LDSAKKACLRQACTLQGRGRGGLTARTAGKEEQRRMVPRSRHRRAHPTAVFRFNREQASRFPLLTKPLLIEI